MQPIALAIGDVVDQIDDAGQHTEDRKRRRGVGDRRRIEQPAAEQQACEDEQVLAPLSRTQGLKKVEGKRTLRYRMMPGTGGRRRG